MSVELTYQDIAEHNTKKDIYVVIHDQIYDVTKFIDEHPGGEEVLLDLGGQDATEAFEDVGHSDEARETLEKLKIGTLKRNPGDPAPNSVATKTPTPSTAQNSTGLGMGIYAVMVVGGLLAYGIYQYMQSKQVAA